MILHKNRWQYIEFSSFFFIFDRKMAAILKLNSFSFFFQKITWDPREVIVWKFEGPTSNGLVATAFFRHFWPFFGGHFEFWKVFQNFFSKGPVRPQGGHCVKIWRSYVKRSSRYFFIPIHIYIYIGAWQRTCSSKTGSTVWSWKF